jgi:hypothetical protein
MKLYIVYTPQFNSFNDQIDPDLPCAWHLTRAAAEIDLEQKIQQQLKWYADMEITGREDEDTAEIIKQHCYIEEHELADLPGAATAPAANLNRLADRQVITVIGALRLFQQNYAINRQVLADEGSDLAPYVGFQPLSMIEIDSLCEDLNFGPQIDLEWAVQEWLRDAGWVDMSPEKSDYLATGPWLKSFTVNYNGREVAILLRLIKEPEDNAAGIENGDFSLSISAPKVPLLEFNNPAIGIQFHRICRADSLREELDKYASIMLNAWSVAASVHDR